MPAPRPAESGVPAAVGPASIARLLAHTPAELSEDALVDAVAAIDRQVSWLHALRAEHLAELAGRADGDYEWEREMLSVGCRISLFEAHQRLETSSALRDRLPRTAEQLATGQLSWGHAVGLARETRELDAQQAADVERRVLRDRRAITPGQWARSARRAALAVQPPPTPELALSDRSLVTFADDRGRGLLARLTDEGAEAVELCLDSLSERTGTDDDRPQDVRRADALVELCQSWLAGRLCHGLDGRGPQVALTMTAGTLLGLNQEPGQLANGAPVSADVARRLACDSDLARLLLDPTSGQVLDLGRSRRFPSAAQRRHLEARDRGCRFPTCHRPAPRCHAHHLTWWSQDGRTDIENLALICLRHHTLVHEGRWTMTLHDGSVTWTSPTGQDYTDPPPHAPD